MQNKNEKINNFLDTLKKDLGTKMDTCEIIREKINDL
jgi:hypothetical protein